MDFPCKRSGEMNPSGSKIELKKLPLLVQGLSCSTMLNWKQSDSMHHCTLRVRSNGNVPESKSSSLTPSARSDSGIDLIISL